jgi:hypothetical protein
MDWLPPSGHHGSYHHEAQIKQVILSLMSQVTFSPPLALGDLVSM